MKRKIVLAFIPLGAIALGFILIILLYQYAKLSFPVDNSTPRKIVPRDTSRDTAVITGEGTFYITPVGRQWTIDNGENVLDSNIVAIENVKELYPINAGPQEPVILIVVPAIKMPCKGSPLIKTRLDCAWLLAEDIVNKVNVPVGFEESTADERHKEWLSLHNHR